MSLGVSLLNAPVIPHVLLEAEADRSEILRKPCRFATRGSAEGGLVLAWLHDYVFQLHGDRCRGVFSCFDRPSLFPD